MTFQYAFSSCSTETTFVASLWERHNFIRTPNSWDNYHLLCKSSCSRSHVERILCLHFCTMVWLLEKQWSSFSQVPEESSIACPKFCCLFQWSKIEKTAIFQHASSSANHILNWVSPFWKIIRSHKIHYLWWELFEHMGQKEKNFRGK